MAAGFVGGQHGVEVDLEAIPEDDALTGELLAAGRTIGCFQIESPGMRNLLKQTAARTMDDVIQSIALIRPGPAGSGMKDAYVRRFRGLEEATPPHPLLEDVLSETYGVMLYQEDVMQVAVALAGMTLGESDRLRRALSKRGGSELEILQARFMEGSRQRGVATKDARHVWELVANFAAFGFCKAHAVTYGRISYRTAYLKAHFPVPFLAAFLASHTGYYAARVYVEEARRLGAAILGPDINRSGADYAFARLKGWPGLRAGLGQVRGLSEDTVAAILSSREADGPFLSLPDVIERTPAQRDEVEALIRTGALDAFDRTRPELLWRLHLLHGPARKAPRLTHGERPLDAMALESLGRSHGDRVAETVPSAGASPGLFDGNTGWGGSGGRLPFTAKAATGNATSALIAPATMWMGRTTARIESSIACSMVRRGGVDRSGDGGCGFDLLREATGDGDSEHEHDGHRDEHQDASGGAERNASVREGRREAHLRGDHLPSVDDPPSLRRSSCEADVEIVPCVDHHVERRRDDDQMPHFEGSGQDAGDPLGIR